MHLNAELHFRSGRYLRPRIGGKLFREYDIKGVIHFAAESHVDNSISGPQAFIETNILGTFTLLDVARNHWMSAPHQVKPGYENARFHHISTDEVYGTLGETGFFTETTAYAPNSPYSASKASSDMIVRSYFHTFGMNVTVSNCSNNYGPKQHPENSFPKSSPMLWKAKTFPFTATAKTSATGCMFLTIAKRLILSSTAAKRVKHITSAAITKKQSRNCRCHLFYFGPGSSRGRRQILQRAYRLCQRPPRPRQTLCHRCYQAHDGTRMESRRKLCLRHCQNR